MEYRIMRIMGWSAAELDATPKHRIDEVLRAIELEDRAADH